MIAAGLWKHDVRGRDGMPYKMVPDKHVFVPMEAGNDMRRVQKKISDFFVYVDVTECRPEWLT